MSNLKKASAALAIGAVALILGCASAKSTVTGDAPNFQPPRGWRSNGDARDVKGFRILGVWSSVGSAPETIAYGYGAVPLQLASHAKLGSYDLVKLGARLNSFASPLGSKVVISGPVMLCDGKTQGWETVTSEDWLGLNATAESVFLLARPVFAMAVYTRSTGSPPSRDAEHALRSLCLGARPVTPKTRPQRRRQ